MYKSTFFTSALVSELELLSKLHAAADLPPGKSPGTNWILGWVDPSAYLDVMEKKNSWPYWDSNSGPSVVQPLAGRYTN
jgi:hypothetical protein